MDDQTYYDQPQNTTEVKSMEAGRVYYSINLDVLPDLLRSKLGPVNTGPGFNDADLRSWLEYSMDDFDEESREQMQEILKFAEDAERLALLDLVIERMDKNGSTWPPLLELGTTDDISYMLAEVADYLSQNPDPSQLNAMVQSVIRFTEVGLPSSIIINEEFQRILEKAQSNVSKITDISVQVAIRLGESMRRVAVKTAESAQRLSSRYEDVRDWTQGKFNES